MVHGKRCSVLEEKPRSQFDDFLSRRKLLTLLYLSCPKTAVLIIWVGCWVVQILKHHFNSCKDGRNKEWTRINHKLCGMNYELTNQQMQTLASEQPELMTNINIGINDMLSNCYYKRDGETGVSNRIVGGAPALPGMFYYAKCFCFLTLKQGFIRGWFHYDYQTHWTNITVEQRWSIDAGWFQRRIVLTNQQRKRNGFTKYILP